MTSRRASDSSPLDRIEIDIATTSEDVEALRRARDQAHGRFTLERINDLTVPDWLPRPRRRRTFEGCEPFEL